MSLTINGATNTLTAASGLAIAGNTAVTGTLSATGITSVTNVTDASAVNVASLKTAGGLGVAKKSFFGDTMDAASAGEAISGTFSRVASFARNSGGSPGVYAGFNTATNAGVFCNIAVAASPSQGIEIWAYNNVSAFSKIATFSAVAASAGLAVTGTLSATGITSVADTTDATSTTAASLKTAGGLAVAKSLYVGGLLNQTNVQTGLTASVEGCRHEADLTYTAAVTEIAASSFVLRSRGAVSQTDSTIGSVAATAAAFSYNTVNIARLSGFRADVRNVSTGVVANAAGLWVMNPANSGGGTLTSFAAVDVEALTGATTNYAFRSAGAGLFKIGDTTDSSSTTTGALVVAGGVGIAKKMYIGDNIVMASGKGIDFSATSDGSGTTTSEVLSDYEEGTWTPTLTFATPGNLSVAYTYQVGKYTKVGRLVTVQFALNLSTFTHTTASGELNITGLPFSSVNAQDQGFGSCLFKGITKAGFTQFSPGSIISSNAIRFWASGSGVTQSTVDAADMPTAGNVILYGSFTYHV